MNDPQSFFSLYGSFLDTLLKPRFKTYPLFLFYQWKSRPTHPNPFHFWTPYIHWKNQQMVKFDLEEQIKLMFFRVNVHLPPGFKIKEVHEKRRELIEAIEKRDREKLEILIMKEDQRIFAENQYRFFEKKIQTELAEIKR